jgi:prevent-host-death family protein
MKTIGIENSNFARCVEDAQQERVIVTRRGKPIAVIIGLEGLDEEQLQLGHDDAFWKLIAARRKRKTLTQAEFDEALAALNKQKAKARKKSK